MNLPEHIGRYQIQSELGRGAMGVVYKAVDPTIGRTVALKTMRLDVHGIEEAEMLKRFKHEAVLAGVMNHPNVITIYDAGDHEGVFYMAMEFMEGVTLQVVLHEQKVIGIDRVLNIARQVCAGLDFAHQRGVIHRDIKPANIMLGNDGSAKIMDFGIAKSGSNMTTAGQVLGTPTYMSPEQVRGRNLDGRSDLFSFGVCLYEMVTGEKPFTGQNITTIIYKIMNEAPIPPRELDVSIHPGISAIITKCLAKNPDERYQTGAELFNDLENYKSYGSSAPSTKVMTAVAGDATMRAAAAALQSAHDLESVTTSHISADVVDEAIGSSLALKTATGTARTGSTVQTFVKSAAPAPTKRKTLAAVMAVVLILVLGAAGFVKVLHARKARAAVMAAQAAQVPATSSAQTAQVPTTGAPQTSAADKPSAAKPLDASAPTKLPEVEEPVVTATTGGAKILSTPDGAKVTIGGASQEKWLTPFAASKLQPGVYDVTVEKAGYGAQTREVDVKAGKVTTLNFDLVQSGITVSVSSQPSGALILIDGRSTGKLTPSVLTIASGRHNLEVRKKGFQQENTNIDLADGEKYTYAPILIAGNASPQLRAEQRERRRGFFSKLFGSGQRIPDGKGMLVVRTTPPGATIIHNGKASPVRTPVQVPMKPGTYHIALRLDGYKNAQRSFTITQGNTTELDVPLEKK